MFDLSVEHVEPERCSFGCAIWCGPVACVLQGPVSLCAIILAMTIFFSSFIWHWAKVGFVHVSRLEQCCCCLRGLLCDSSDMNDALWMCIILPIHNVLLASGLWLAVDITFF